MKKILVIISLFLSANIFAQDPSDNEFQMFMQEHANYISFKDSVKLAPKIKRSYHILRDFLAKRDENILEYYVDNDFVLEIFSNGHDMYYGSDSVQPGLQLYIYHINTMITWMNFKKENPIKYNELNNGKHSITQMIGNVQKKDGWFQIPYYNEPKLTIFE